MGLFRKSQAYRSTGRSVLQSRGGGGSTHSQLFRWWAWPLPPRGPLEFICRWPMYEIAGPLPRCSQYSSTPFTWATGNALTS